MIAHQADGWIEAMDRKREEMLGGIIPQFVGLPHGEGQRPKFPLGFKKCSHCRQSSTRRLPLDGRPFFHSVGKCNSARIAFYRTVTE